MYVFTHCVSVALWPLLFYSPLEEEVREEEGEVGAGVHFTWGEGQDTGPRDTWNLHPELFGN